MAVYGRHRERWIPTKRKSKVSKNNTFEIDGTTSKVLFWMNVEEKVGDDFIGPVGQFGPSLTSVPLSGYGDVIPQLDRVRSAHFQPTGLHFDKNGSQRSYIQTGENELDVTPDMIGGVDRTHDTWVSFWVKTYQYNFDGSKGHNLGGLYRTIANSPAEGSSTSSLNPFMLFNLSLSGAPILRFHEKGNPSNRLYYVSDVTPSDKNVEPNQWALVTWLIKVPAMDGMQRDYSSMVQLWIDGHEVPVSAQNESGGDPDSSDVSWWDTDQLELVLGNQTRGYEADNTLGVGEGFWGSLAEFLIFTSPEGDVNSRTQMAKFLYEAQREGAYHLHSGIHNSTPRLELLDLDRDTAYPPTTSLPAYSVISKEEAQPRTLQRSTTRFYEGVLSDPTLSEGYPPGTVEAWSEKASKWYVPSNQVLPHLRLDPTDTILTQGEWYSDARSEFFTEDLDPTDPTGGFLVPDASSDELYREHPQTTSLPPFRDLSETSETFKNTRVIEIPLVNLAEMVLTTDSTAEVSQLNSTYTGTSPGDGLDAVVQTDPAQAINTMAYYNFDNQQWEATTPSWSTYAAAPGNPEWVENADIGFSPMSGLVIPRQINQLEAVLDSYGRPMSDFGFPFHDKFSASDGQTIDLSKYIDEEVILEGWEISTPVIPVVGYQQDTSGTEANTVNGPSGFWPALDQGGGLSAFYYGAHGEACQLWNESREPNPFIDRQVDSRSGSGRYGYNNTIPVSNPDEEPSWSTQPVGTYYEPYKPYYQTPGFVTKGVTAFLMKQKTATKVTQDKITKWRSDSHLYNFSFNSGPFGSYTSTPTVRYLGIQKDASNPSDWPEYYTQPFESVTDFESTTERELLGYLQHLYHNDPQPERQRKEWRRYIPEFASKRKNDNGDYIGYYDGVEPKGWPELSLVEKLECENQTYVPNLLRVNHTDLDEYAFHVKGSMKQITPFAGAVPITAFKVVSVRDIPGNIYTQPNVGFIDKLNAVNREYFISQGVVPSNQGHIPSGLVNYDAMPSVTGKTSATSIMVPELCAPITGSGAYIDGNGDPKEYSWAGDDLVALTRKLDVVQNPDPDGDVILRPTDKLVLGIQDSVSTTIGGQQTIYNGSENAFIRWGRNTLRIPETKSGYLRLYVRKTRNDKGFNQVADQNQYNVNVNRDLGDHDIDDRFFISDPITYSGSISDDVIGPSYASAPIIAQQINESDGSSLILPPDQYIIGSSLVDAFRTLDDNVNIFGYNLNAATTRRVATAYSPTSSQAALENLVGLNQPLGVRPWDSVNQIIETTNDDFIFNWKYLSARALDYDADLHATGIPENAPFIPLQFPLHEKYLKSVGGNPDGQEVDYPIYETIFRSIRYSFQSILVHPSNLFLKPGGNNVDFHRFWNPSIPDGDVRQYTDGSSRTQWSGPEHGYREVRRNGELIEANTGTGASPVWVDVSDQWWKAVPEDFNQVYGGTGYFGLLGGVAKARRFGDGMISILDELDDRDQDIPLSYRKDYSNISWVDEAGDTQYFDMGHHAIANPSNVSSGWYQRINFPVLQKTTAYLEPSFVTSQVEFRFVQVGTFAAEGNGPGGNYPTIQTLVNNSWWIASNSMSQEQGFGTPWIGKFPLYPNTDEEMRLGDAFYLDQNGHAVRLKVGQEALDADLSLSDDQRWARKWQGTKSQRGGQVIYIVGAEYILRCPWGQTDKRVMPALDLPHTVYTYNDLYSKIAEVLTAAAHFDSGLLWTKAVANDGTLTLQYPDDPVIRGTLEQYKASIDASNIFTLLGVQAAPPVAPYEAYFDLSAKDLYLRAHPDEDPLTSWWNEASGVFAGQFLLDYQNRFWYEDPSEGPGIPADPDDLSLKGEVLASGNAYLKGYLPKWAQANPNTPADQIEIEGYPAGTLSGGGFKVDFSGLPDSVATIEIIEETFTQRVGENIDRGVQFRTSRGDAGPFGSLNPFMKLRGAGTIWDSVPPKITIFKEETLDITQGGFEQGWLPSVTEEKIFEPRLRNINTRVDVASGGGSFVAQFVQDGLPIVQASLDATDTFTWNPAEASDPTSSWPQLFTDGIFPVRNYIQQRFSGLRDYSTKTALDLVLGFGDSPSGRHRIRPNVYKYYSFQNFNADTGQLNTDPTLDESTVVVDISLDPPRGARFGLFNINMVSGSYVFSNRSFGQFRDMLEQAIDTKMTGFGEDESILGSPTVVNPINPINPRVPKLMDDTSRYNKTVNATIDRPYIENGNLEEEEKRAVFRAESLRVDVVGSIKESKILKPGSSASNIRRR